MTRSKLWDCDHAVRQEHVESGHQWCLMCGIALGKTAEKVTHAPAAR